MICVRKYIYMYIYIHISLHVMYHHVYVSNISYTYTLTCTNGQFVARLNCAHKRNPEFGIAGADEGPDEYRSVKNIYLQLMMSQSCEADRVGL